MNKIATLIFLSFLLLTSCSSGDDSRNQWGNLFRQAPASPDGSTPTPSITPDNILGLWGATARIGDITFDVRLQIESNQVTMANRCILPDGDSLLAGVTAAARITPQSVVVLESKYDQSQTTKNGKTWTCNASATPIEVKYIVTGTRLIVFQPGEGIKEMVKIHD